MKAEQSSLYRNLEILHLWALETFANAPKEQGVRVNVKIIIESIIDAQTAIAIALNCENLKQKFDLLDVVVMNMTKIKSCTKVLTEYSSGSEKANRIITKKQRIRLLDIMSQIGTELGRWRNKTAAAISKTAAKLPND